MKIIHGRGADIATTLQQRIRATCPGVTLSHDDPESAEGRWTQSIQLRQGRWTGVDIEVREQDGQTTIETETGSQGASTLLILAVVLALGLSLASGDWLLQLVGVRGVTTTLTRALGTIPFLFVTVPAAMAAQFVLGRGGAAESQRLLERVDALVDELGAHRRNEATTR